ncbi:MAG TPA: hypothetical protein VI873_01405 [Candidatus Peribacteraceae bacterium]|nr:hypothetical protein [Candidatus Peribacteraceae bacterium]
MATKDDGSTGNAKDITLHDVVEHMQNMEQRLSGEMKDLSTKFDDVGRSLIGRMDRLTIRLSMVETNLLERMDALEEDLTATMKDTMKIRQHVGMVSTDDI